MLRKGIKITQKGVKGDHWSQADSANVLSPCTAAGATFAPDERLWILRVRLDMGFVGLIMSERGRNTTP